VILGEQARVIFNDTPGPNSKMNYSGLAFFFTFLRVWKIYAMRFFADKMDSPDFGKTCPLHRLIPYRRLMPFPADVSSLFFRPATSKFSSSPALYVLALAFRDLSVAPEIVSKQI